MLHFRSIITLVTIFSCSFDCVKVNSIELNKLDWRSFDQENINDYEEHYLDLTNNVYKIYRNKHIDALLHHALIIRADVEEFSKIKINLKESIDTVFNELNNIIGNILTKQEKERVKKFIINKFKSIKRKKKEYSKRSRIQLLTESIVLEKTMNNLLSYDSSEISDEDHELPFKLQAGIIMALCGGFIYCTGLPGSQMVAGILVSNGIGITLHKLLDIKEEKDEIIKLKRKVNKEISKRKRDIRQEYQDNYIQRTPVYLEEPNISSQGCPHKKGEYCPVLKRFIE